jgi:D-xylulose reductase
MKALVLEKVKQLSLRDFDIREELGPDDVRIAIHTVGICGSDLHYIEHGKIGSFVVREPMILGHEASGTILEVGSRVTHLTLGDRVCMEPGIPNPISRATRLGIYNLDPDVRFWATPPVHGCLRETVVHPAAFTFRLPANVSYAEGAMVEPLAIGMHAAAKAAIKPGDLAVVVGAGTIGVVSALSLLAGGCSKVIVTDVKKEKLDIAGRYTGITPVDVRGTEVRTVVKDETGGWGADIVVEASGSDAVYSSLFDLSCPRGRVVLVGMPTGPAPIDVVAAQAKELTLETIFRYAHAYPRALALMGSGKIDLKPLITEVYPFSESLKAFSYAASPRPTSVKVQIEMNATEKTGNKRDRGGGSS